MSTTDNHNNAIEQNDTAQQFIKYPNGDTYKGNVDENGFPHGYGVMKYARGGDTFAMMGIEVANKEYSGEWLHGNRTGTGKMKYYKNDEGFARYTGKWSNNLPNGTGCFENNCGKKIEYYEGTWKEGLRHGIGTHSIVQNLYHWKQVYEGEWENDVRCGKGIYKYSGMQSYIYDGEWRENKYNGHGTLRFDYGDYIECEWSDNLKNGAGVYTFADDTRFKAQWIDDELQIDSVKPDNNPNAMLLLINVEHSGFDYNRSATILLHAKEGEYTMDNVGILCGTKTWNRNQALITITEISEGKLKYIIPADFAEGDEPTYGSIARGEKAEHGFSLDATATIYEEDYDYTITGSIVIECR